MKKTIGIIGAGNIARALAGHFLKSDYQVILSNSKGGDSLKDVLAMLGSGASAGTPEDAATADIVILAMPWTKLSTLEKLTDWKGKLVIDATNAYVTFEPLVLADLGGRPSTDIVAEHVAGATVIKAFNTLWFKILAEDPRTAGGHRVIFYAGDDQAAKKEVAQLIESIGFSAVNSGSLANSVVQEPKGPLMGQNLIRLPYEA